MSGRPACSLLDFGGPSNLERNSGVDFRIRLSNGRHDCHSGCGARDLYDGEVAPWLVSVWVLCWVFSTFLIESLASG